MAQAALFDLQGQEVGQVELEDSVFGIKPNRAVMHEAVVAHLRNCRQGTSDTKGRGEIRGGGRKPWRQKGTGHARQGSTRAPHWRHGGIVFGPTPRNLERRVPTKVSKLARRSALSAKLADGEMKFINEIAVDAIKTSSMVAALATLGAERSHSALLVLPTPQEDRTASQRIYLSCRNIPNVTVCTAENLSAYDIIRNRHVYVDQGAVARIVEILKP